jgi:hypothetical protein
MTTESRVRGGLSGRAPRDEDDDEDGERGGDPALRAMRSVWLGMRDEDPPEGGLAELLAAARAKAATMQPRPTSWQRLWQRSVENVRRPPALALATVMVLLGGAVILGRRGMEVPPPAGAPAASGGPATDAASRTATKPAGSRSIEEREEREERRSPQAVSQAALTATDGLAAPRAGSAGEATVPPGAPAKAEVAVSAVSPEAATTAKVALRDAVGSEAPAKAEVTVKDAVGSEASGKAAAGMVAPVGHHTAADPGVMTALQDTDRLARGAAEPPPRRVPGVEPAELPATPPPPKPKAFASAAPPAPSGRSQAGADDLVVVDASAHNTPQADAGEAAKNAEPAETTIAKHDKSGAAPAVPLAQLYQQCESAARRGDCTAVRRMVGQITKTDRDYRARVAKGSPVAKCLAE